MSVDQASTQLLQKVLEELSIRFECCADFVRAGIRLVEERFDAVVVDDGKFKRQVMSLLREIRHWRRTRNSHAEFRLCLLNNRAARPAIVSQLG